jgi:hypothetical protein
MEGMDMDYCQKKKWQQIKGLIGKLPTVVLKTYGRIALSVVKTSLGLSFLKSGSMLGGSKKPNNRGLKNPLGSSLGQAPPLIYRPKQPRGTYVNKTGHGLTIGDHPEYLGPDDSSIRVGTSRYTKVDNPGAGYCPQYAYLTFFM